MSGSRREVTKDILQGSVLEPKLRAGRHLEISCALLLWEVLLVPGTCLLVRKWDDPGSGVISIQYFAPKGFFLPVGLKNEQRNLSVRDHKGNVCVLFNWMGNESHLEMSLEKSSSQDASSGTLRIERRVYSSVIKCGGQLQSRVNLQFCWC